MSKRRLVLLAFPTGAALLVFLVLSGARHTAAQSGRAVAGRFETPRLPTPEAQFPVGKAKGPGLGALEELALTPITSGPANTVAPIVPTACI